MNKTIIPILEKKEVKPTAVRELVLDVFLKNNYALSLSDIENILTWSDRVTIYRTLKTFVKKAVIHEINDGSSSIKYALCADSCTIEKHVELHPHFHCENCGKTICLDKQEINIQNLPENLIVNNYSLIINGLCGDCSKTQT